MNSGKWTEALRLKLGRQLVTPIQSSLSLIVQLHWTCMPQTFDHDASCGISNTELFCTLVRYPLINAVKKALGGGPEPGITTEAPPFTPSAPHPVTTPPNSGGCQAFGSWKGNAAMNQWCVNNCKLGYCPADRCKCIWRQSLSAFLHQIVWKHIMNCSCSIDQLHELKMFMFIVEKSFSSKEFPASAYLWCFLLEYLNECVNECSDVNCSWKGFAKTRLGKCRPCHADAACQGRNGCLWLPDVCPGDLSARWHAVMATPLGLCNACSPLPLSLFFVKMLTLSGA